MKANNEGPVKVAATVATPARTRAKKPAIKPEPPKAPKNTKTARILALLQRPNGATLETLIAYASHCTSPGRCEGFSLTKRLFDNLTPLPFCGGMSPGSS